MVGNCTFYWDNTISAHIVAEKTEIFLYMSQYRFEIMNEFVRPKIEFGAFAFVYRTLDCTQCFQI